MNRSNADKLKEWNYELSANYIVNDVFLVLYLILGVSGNVIVIINYSFRMKNQKDDRYFIPYLATVDLFACGFRTSLELAMNVNPVNFRGSLLCKTLWFPTNVFAISSIFLLLVISFHRYLKICHPFGIQMTLFWKRTSLSLSLIVAIVFSIPLVIYNDEIEVIDVSRNVTGYVCDIDVNRYYGTWFLAYTASASISSLFIMILLAIFNSFIGRSIYLQMKARNRRSSRNEDNRSSIPVPLLKPVPDMRNNTSLPDMRDTISTTDKNQTNNNCRIIIENDAARSRKMSFSHRYSFMFMAIGAAFIISYVPRMVVLAVSLKDPRFFGKLSNIELSFVAFSREMNVINNVVNPFIYGFFDQTFRKETKNLLCRNK